MRPGARLVVAALGVACVCIHPCLEAHQDVAAGATDVVLDIRRQVDRSRSGTRCAVLRYSGTRASTASTQAASASRPRAR